MTKDLLTRTIKAALKGLPCPEERKMAEAALILLLKQADSRDYHQEIESLEREIEDAREANRSLREEVHNANDRAHHAEFECQRAQNALKALTTEIAAKEPDQDCEITWNGRELIPAVKAWRHAFDSGLANAKHAVEALREPGSAWKGRLTGVQRRFLATCPALTVREVPAA